MIHDPDGLIALAEALYASRPGWSPLTRADIEWLLERGRRERQRDDQQTRDETETH